MIIRTEQLPVEYATVTSLISELWSKSDNIALAIHCGVGKPGAIKLEQYARNAGYVKFDNKTDVPQGGIVSGFVCRSAKLIIPHIFTVFPYILTVFTYH